jgi:F-type H+-transporting ATPase subunit gamma
MSTLRELKTRIGSVSSSEKITGAMKMISSAKVHKSERDLRRLLPFKDQIKSIMGHLLAADGDYTSPLTEEREVSKVGIVVFGSDDGLCGAYNVNIFKQMLVIMNNYREQYGDSTSFTVFPVGKKMLKAVKKIDGGFISVKSVKGVDSKMTGDKVTEFTEELKHAFISGELDKVIVVYMNFKSISRQILTEEQLFPVEASALGGELDAKSANKLYIFEPDGNRIFNEVLPMFVLSTMQEITIENRASEQAARIMAMQSANDNAKKLLESLRLEYNKLRQQSITTELLDILGGQVEK